MTVHQCSTLAEVRENIDRLDRRIIPLLAERAGYVAQAGALKQQKSQVVDHERIEAIISKVRHQAIEEGMDPDLAENIYRAMINAYIMYETHIWKDLHPEE